MSYRAPPSGVSLTEADAAVAKGMLARGDRQHDIAAWFGVNGGRVAELASGKLFWWVGPVPVDHRLPRPARIRVVVKQPPLSRPLRPPRQRSRLQGEPCCFAARHNRRQSILGAGCASILPLFSFRRRTLTAYLRAERQPSFAAVGPTAKRLWLLGENGAPGEIRTPGPQIRSLVLYPAELRARMRGAASGRGCGAT